MDVLKQRNKRLYSFITNSNTGNILKINLEKEVFNDLIKFIDFVIVKYNSNLGLMDHTQTEIFNHLDIIMDFEKFKPAIENIITEIEVKGIENVFKDRDLYPERFIKLIKEIIGEYENECRISGFDYDYIWFHRN